MRTEKDKRAGLWVYRTQIIMWGVLIVLGIIMFNDPRDIEQRIIGALGMSVGLTMVVHTGLMNVFERLKRLEDVKEPSDEEE